MNPSIFERTHLMPKLSKKATFIKEYEVVVASWVRKAYICFCLDDQDSFEDEIDVEQSSADTRRNQVFA